MKNFLSKALVAAGGSALLLLAGACQKTPPAPTVTISAGSATESSITFSIEAADAYWVSYMVLPYYEKAPATDEVLSDGVKAELAGMDITVEGLDPGMEYFVYAAAESSYGVSEARASIQTEGESYYVVESTQTNAWYYGRQESGYDMFLLQLSDVECEPYNLRPQDAGQYIRFYLVTEPLEGSEKENPVLATGTYTCGTPGEEAPGTFFVTTDGSGYPSSFAYGPSSNLEEWMGVLINSGEITVENEDGVYTVRARITIADGENSPVIGYSCSEIITEDLSDGLRHMYYDVTDMEFDSFGATITSSSNNPEVDTWSASGVACPVDEYGFITGAGYVMNFSLYPPSQEYGKYEIEGTYTPSEDFAPYTYYPGYVYSNPIIGTMGAGTYMAYYGEDLTAQFFGLVVDGEINITRDGETYHVEAYDLTTSKGYNISFSYDGPLSPINDYRFGSSSTAAPATVKVPFGAGKVEYSLSEPWTPAI